MLYFPAPFHGPIVSASSNEGLFGKRRPVALIRTLFQVICSHPYKDSDPQQVLYYLPSSKGPTVSVSSTKAFVESPDH